MSEDHQGKIYITGDKHGSVRFLFGLAEQKLFEYAGDIDYIITHEAPLSARRSIARQKRIDDNYLLPAVLEDWLTKIRQSTRLKRWDFGHMHVDQEIPPFMRAIFNNVLELDTGRRIPWA